MTETKLTPKVFLNKVLAGTAAGIIVGLIPNAVLSGILKLFGDNVFAKTLSMNALIFQIATPLVIGAMIAIQFGLLPAQVMVTAGAAFVGSGVIKYNADTQAFIGKGTGDVINTMITAAIAVGLILLIGDRFGSVAIILTPIVVGLGAGSIGYYLYPYVTKITAAIGNVIGHFTDLHPMLMTILICSSFAVLTISPISTVAIGMAIQLDGIGAGAAAMGVGVAAVVLVVNSWKVNKPGVTIAISLGAMKMMMPNLFTKPVMIVPLIMTGAISAIPVSILNIQGTPSSAGFGLVGLVGPLASIELGLNVLYALLAWIVIPVLAALFSQFVCEKIFKLYDRNDVFKYNN